MIKEFTPLLGYISWSNFQWIIFIICSKVLKQCFTMLIMQNRWLQWLQNVQKPLVGLFLHLVWPKIEENTLPGSFSPILVVSALQNAPTMQKPGLYITKPRSAFVSECGWISHC
jgi:hypothetical protein